MSAPVENLLPIHEQFDADSVIANILNRTDEKPCDIERRSDAEILIDAHTESLADIRPLLDGPYTVSIDTEDIESEADQLDTLCARYTIAQHLATLNEHLNGITDGSDAGIRDILPAAILTETGIRTALQSGMIGRAKTGKVLSRAEDKLNAGDTSALLNIRARNLISVLIQANAWAADSIRKEIVNHRLILSFNPKHIERLGHYGNCDNTGGVTSCFGRGREFGLAPLTLLNSPGSFVALLEDKLSGDYVGRAWGVVNATRDAAVLSNVYANGDGKAAELIYNGVGQLLRRIGVANTGPQAYSLSDIDTVYINHGSTRLYTASAYPHRVWGWFEPVAEDGVVCDCCGERTSSDQATTVANGDVVCEYCLDRNYSYCDINHEYYPNDEIVYVEDSDMHVWDQCDQLYTSREGTHFLVD
ncbi:MAG: hypothetical protein AAGG38_02120 [Planctomycetota bacterium]